MNGAAAAEPGVKPGRHRRPAAADRAGAARGTRHRHDRRDARADALHGQARRSWMPSGSTSSWTTRATTTTCSPRPIRRSAAPSTPSGCMPARWCATAAPCRSGIGELGDALIYALLLRHQQNDAWRGALERAGRGHAPPTDRGDGRRRRPSRAACSPPARCSSTSCWSCTAPACCAGAPMTAWRSSGLLAAGQAERFDASILPALLAAGVGPTLSEAQFAEPQAPRRVSRGRRVHGGPRCARAAGSGSAPT